MTVTARQVPVKRTDETLRVDASWEDSAEMRSDETIASVQSVVISPSGLSKDGETVSGQRVQLLLSGGTDGTRYTVTVTVTTSSNQVLVLEGDLEVRD